VFSAKNGEDATLLLFKPSQMDTIAKRLANSYGPKPYIFNMCTIGQEIGW